MCVFWRGSGHPYIGQGGVAGKETPHHRSAPLFISNRRIETTLYGWWMTLLHRQGTPPITCEENQKRTRCLGHKPTPNQQNRALSVLTGEKIGFSTSWARRLRHSRISRLQAMLLNWPTSHSCTTTWPSTWSTAA